jgi:hypothetical protein
MRTLAISLCCAAASAATVTVDVGADRHPIDPRIYGVAHADAAALAALRAPLNRWGGNNTSRYNWQQNADNRANDWYFESIAYGSSTPGAEVDAFIQASRTGGGEPLVTVPIIGWVAKVAADRSKLASFSIAKYGAQTGSDWQWFPDAGNGILSSTGLPVVNTPGDANVANSTALQQGWVQHLVGTWGSATAGGVRWYVLDNEYGIWHSTHRDVQPTGVRLTEMRDAMVAYATMIKAQDPGALVMGPEEWGWTGYLYSGYDAQYASQHGWSSFPDRAANGNRDAMPWLLAQLKQASTTAGKRLLDAFTVHYYPQGGEFSDDVSAAMQARRNRSTRSLWDPAYTDETWIATQVRLIPRLKQWVADDYPGTPVGITEYNWGAENHINGATAQADVLGIFGREGLDLAARWATPAATTLTFKAMQLYRNYDGAGSGFGETSVRATAPTPDSLAAFAAQRADGALTVMLINKVAAAASTTVAISGFTAAGSAQVWQLTAANSITHPANLTVTSGSLTTTLPGQSITLLVVPAANQPPAVNPPANADGPRVLP